MRGAGGFALFLLGAAVFAGCSSQENRRVVVLGFDGLDPVAVNEFVAQGKLPNLARLAREGATGPLRGEPPLLSPVLWTTIATGKPPLDHGIGHFVARDPAGGEPLPVTSRMRRVKALWNILSETGRQVGVVGWWATWPAEHVNGTVVSDRLCYHFLFPQQAGQSAAPKDVIFPAERMADLVHFVRRPADIGFAELQPYARVSQEELSAPFRFDNDLGQLRWALATAATYRDIGLHLWQKDQPAALFVYIEATDTVSHLFGHLLGASNLAGPLASQQERFGRATEQVYKLADEIAGAFARALDDHSTLVILSDHGFDLGVLPDDPRRALEPRRASEASHRLDGVLLFWGRGIKSGARFKGARQIDVVPTLLALLGAAPARDMPGRVLTEALSVRAPAPVATYEIEGSGFRPTAAGPDSTDALVRDRLRSLGYLADDSASRELSIEGERVLAEKMFEAGRPEQAEAALCRLVAQNPGNARLRGEWGAVLGALGRYAEARRELDAVLLAAPLDPAAWYNRGVVRAAQGDRDGAVQDYRQALNCEPGFKTARWALRELEQGRTAAPLELPARLALGARLAERAAGEARRGGYAAADRTLDEAERIAPDLAMVHHHRANVAFLRGDRKGAILALERALALEPDNVLLKEDLERLRRAGEARPK